MERRLRLAERQGLLQGDLNPPQYLGLELLMITDTRSRHEDFADRLRIAMVGAHPELGSKLLPDWMGDKQSGDEEVVEDVPTDPAKGYSYTEEITDPEEVERLLKDFQTMDLAEVEDAQNDWI